MDFTAFPQPPDNSSSSSSSSGFCLCPTAATRIFLPSMYTLLFLTALPGNALSLWVFLRCISTTSPTHVYLSHLSVSNLLLSLTAPFLAAYYAWGSEWRLSGALCQLVLHLITPVLHINVYISLVILTWVALCRFAVLIQHTHASRPSACTTLLPHTFFTRLLRASFARWVCATVWVVAVGGIVPVTVYYSVNEAMSGSSSADGAAEEGGRVEVCYSPAVEIGGSLSKAFSVPLLLMFFIFYLLVLLFYMTLLRHLRRSRHGSNISTSQSLLGRALRNIVIIQVVLSVCLLPYHIFKPIFISVAHHQLTSPPNTPTHCHPLSTLIELKNCLLLLATLRGSADPVMYFLLDKTFHHQTLLLLGCSRNKGRGKEAPGSDTGSAGHKGQVGGGGELSLGDRGLES
ncbi:probable G-protein coupled receptor 82 [Platichthys flesus]|uniref:probable G-protein coupled receptor 82 n=1 Tax=Platichthys flesus TaxID=8260 RepID=UPI002DBA6745|nr:probable G-protein coupled receptor 82 [Platichthys flesus]